MLIVLNAIKSFLIFFLVINLIDIIFQDFDYSNAKIMIIKNGILSLFFSITFSYIIDYYVKKLYNKSLSNETTIKKYLANYFYLIGGILYFSNDKIVFLPGIRFFKKYKIDIPFDFINQIFVKEIYNSYRMKIITNKKKYVFLVNQDLDLTYIKKRNISIKEYTKCNLTSVC